MALKCVRCTCCTHEVYVYWRVGNLESTSNIKGLPCRWTTLLACRKRKATYPMDSPATLTFGNLRFLSFPHLDVCPFSNNNNNNNTLLLLLASTRGRQDHIFPGLQFAPRFFSNQTQLLSFLQLVPQSRRKTRLATTLLSPRSPSFLEPSVHSLHSLSFNLIPDAIIPPFCAPGNASLVQVACYLVSVTPIHSFSQICTYTVRFDAQLFIAFAPNNPEASVMTCNPTQLLAIPDLFGKSDFLKHSFLCAWSIQVPYMVG